MSHQMLRPFIVKVSVLGYFPYLHRLREANYTEAMVMWLFRNTYIYIYIYIYI